MPGDELLFLLCSLCSFHHHLRPAYIFGSLWPLKTASKWRHYVFQLSVCPSMSWTSLPRSPAPSLLPGLRAPDAASALDGSARIGDILASFLCGVFINVTDLDCCPLDQTPVVMVRMCCNIWQKTSCRSAHLQPYKNLHKLQSMFDTIMILATKSGCFFSGGTENSFFLLSSLLQQNPAKSCVPSLNSLNFPSSHNSPHPLFDFQDLELITLDSNKEPL